MISKMSLRDLALNFDEGVGNSVIMGEYYSVLLPREALLEAWTDVR